MTHTRLRTAALAAAISAVVLSGCTATGWVAEAPPAAGTQAELPSLEKARNMLFVVDDAGDGVLLGTISTVDATDITQIAYVAQDADGVPGTPEALDYVAQLGNNDAVQLSGPELVVSNPELVAGMLADVTIQFDGDRNLSLEVPIYSSEHPDFAAAWSEATGK